MRERVLTESAAPGPPPGGQSLPEVIRQKDALFCLTDRLQRARSFNEIYAAGLDAIHEALRCGRASILLCDGERVMRFVAWRALSEGYRKAVEGHSPWAPDERNPVPVCVEDIECADLGRALKAVIHAEGIAAVGFYPLIGAAGLIGKFMTYWNTRRIFSAAEIELSLTIARQLALAIERRRADEALRAELADTRLLQEISSAFIDQANASSVYDKIIDAAMTIMRSDFASMQMLHAERGPKGELQLLAFRGFNSEAAKLWEWVGLDSGSICGQALRSRDRVITQDVHESDLVDNDHLAVFTQNGIRAVLSSPLFSRDGTLVGMISTHWREPHAPSERDLRLLDILARQAADLIERARAVDALAQSEARLREDDRRKNEFLAILGHELRNPLAPITNAVRLLGTGGADDRVHQYARGVIERQAARLTRLVEDLLEVSRITSGRIQLHREHVALAGVIERAVESARPLIEERRHILQVRMPPEPVWLYADAIRLEQILVNLLNNAAKYTDAGGSIELTLHAGEGDAILCVRDNGIGIDQDLLPRIFQIFTQAEQSLDRSSGGLGIGLALVRRLVELHNGTVVVHSRPGHGSEFSVRLPLAESTPEPGFQDSLTGPVATGQPLRVLVVDDNVDAAQTLGMLLEAAGHQVRLAHHGEAGIDIAHEHRPQAVFLDIGLPRLDGYEVARRLREDVLNRSTCLVAMTGYGQSIDRERARTAGFDHHLVKPADFSRVQAILANIQPDTARCK